VDLRQSLDALGLQAPVVDAGLVGCLFEGMVGVAFPRFAPGLQVFLAVPGAAFGAEPRGAEGAGGEQDVGVRVVAAGVV
jgi:hypothetical protein